MRRFRLVAESVGVNGPRGRPHIFVLRFFNFSTRYLVIAWLSCLLIAFGASQLLTGETSLRVVRQDGQLWAEVQGTRLEVPTDTLQTLVPAQVALPMLGQLRIESPTSSLYWQETQPGILSFIGDVGERLQYLRPSASWTAAASTGADSGVYKLKGGRSLALLPLGDGKDGLVLEVRPERSVISWWTLKASQPDRELAETNYRPSGLTSLGDLASEVALVALAATLLLGFAWGLAVGVAAISRRVIAQDTSNPTMPTRLLQRPRLGARPSHVALAFFLGGTLLATIACLYVLEGIPHVQDEVAYMFQGRIFAHLRSWAPVPPSPEFFQSAFVQIYDGRWFSKYPPGYPLMLALGVWAGVPWLVNAFSAGASLALIYAAGLRMFGRQVAAWAGLFGLISPWVIFMSGSYMSHPTTMLWVALFLYALVQSRLSEAVAGSRRSFGPPSRWALVAGFAIGMAFITREWTALGIGLGAALWGIGDIVSARKDAPRKVAIYAMVVVGFLPPLLFLLYQNHELTGDWFRLAQDLVGSYDQPGFGPGHGSEIGHTPAMGLYNGLVYLRTLATMFNGWPAPFALAPVFLGLFAWWRGPKKEPAWDALLWLPLVGLLAAYFAWWSSTTIYGPRYWYEGMPFLLLMAGRGMDLLGRIAVPMVAQVWARQVRWLVPAVVFTLFTAYALTQTLPAQVKTYTDYNDISGESLQVVAKAHLTNALVFVALDPDQPNRDYGKAFFATDPMLEGNIVYVRDLGFDANQYYASLFPDRKPYWLPLVGDPQEGVGPK